jgi:transcriptional regulator with XRE-family HTH domain
MNILKSFREKFALSQQELATLLGMTREYYSMVEIGKRMLPAQPAQLLPELLPLMNYPVTLPEWPQEMPPEQLEACREQWLRAKQDLYKASQALQDCETALLQQQALAHLITAIENHPQFSATPTHRRLLETLAYKKDKLQKTVSMGTWVLLTTQKQIAQYAVQAYEKLLPLP